MYLVKHLGLKTHPWGSPYTETAHTPVSYGAEISLLTASVHFQMEGLGFRRCNQLARCSPVAKADRSQLFMGILNNLVGLCPKIK